MFLYVYTYIHKMYKKNKLYDGSKGPHLDQWFWATWKWKITARLKIASSLPTNGQILRISAIALFSHPLVCEVQWPISSSSKKGLLKDVLLFSRPWGHTITAVHSCFSHLDIGRIRERFVIVTEFPWKAQWQPVHTWLGLCSSSAVVSKPNRAAEASSIFIRRIADKCAASYRLIGAQWDEKNVADLEPGPRRCLWSQLQLVPLGSISNRARDCHVMTPWLER